MTTLKNLFLDQLAEMYEAEQEFAKMLSRMSKLALNDELKQTLRSHAYESVGHISKVGKVFQCFGEPTSWMEGSAVRGLLAEAFSGVAQHRESPAKDAAIIEAAQKLEHFGIAIYGCLRDWARVLNNLEAAVLLEEILDEEKSGDLRLTDIAHVVNVEALGETAWFGGSMESEEDGLLCHPGYERAAAHHGGGRKRR